ncbi:hypothetical protein AAMO2058_000201100 [Amorphochlora amoebiformis]|uniref:RRM domain-containing protein n=1 Tax=Amorphochlora amoebiformis TaxID=1561963 RepID=A0A7S0D4Y7_9EUKA|mmetsp:Transcript_19429/g.30865  ORF Transcript_19429/g.30865 Transcript_19429/m.30865 type:complete len:437 (+) Transcript_19429:93-1403(+)
MEEGKSEGDVKSLSSTPQKAPVVSLKAGSGSEGKSDEKGKPSTEETKGGLEPPSKNVYFWGVPSDYTEFEMNLLVFACGDVVSIHMGKPNGKPFTYALVQFAKQDEAEQAVKLLNDRPFNNRKLVVRYAKPPKASVPSNPVMFSPLNMAISLDNKGNKQRRAHSGEPLLPAPQFMPGPEPYPIPPTGMPYPGPPPYAPRGYPMDPSQFPGGYPNPPTYAAVQPGGQPMNYKFSPRQMISAMNQTMGPSSLSNTNIYVSGLPEMVNDAYLQNLFSPYGKILSTKIIINRNTGQPLGTALVRMDSPPSASSAIENLNGAQLSSGQLLACRFANEKRVPTNSTTNLYISGLPEDITEASLKNLFSPFGTVVSMKIIMNRETGNPLGTALVRMDTNEQAVSCINKLNGNQLNGGKFLKVRFATEKVRKQKESGSEHHPQR